MVSLGNDNRSGSGGGYFFSRDAQLFDETDEASLVSSVLISNEEPNFKVIPITGIIVLEIISAIALMTSAFLVPYFLEEDSCFILSCAHAGYWCIIFITSCYRNYKHNYLQRCGYLEFFRNTQLLQRVPLIVLSLGNVMLVVVLAVFQRFCILPQYCPTNSMMHCENYLQILFGCEMLILLPCLIKYLVIVVKFNKSKSIPDVHQDDLLISYLQSYAPTNEIGFRDEDYMEEILEKQADMIRYLKQHSSNLSRKILKLSAQLESMQSTSQRF
ncbi:transmembrane protein 192 [Caerostris darwini]|uniref:Transmembrane protein 192 n=1 Tax=Caerostris darwini TaxID=1538125 RepID=A0AAV4SG45_9ARAC|nr:transmembrane protein 192 [Caerostris darwini]